jgi:hypothetical protein
MNVNKAKHNIRDAPSPIQGRGRLGGWSHIGRFHSFMKSGRGNRVTSVKKEERGRVSGKWIVKR